MSIKSPLFFCLFVSVFVTNSVIADTALTFTDTNPQGATRTSSIQIHGNMIRTSDSSSKIYTLFDTEKKTMYTINPEVKQYKEDNIDSIKKNITAAVAAQEKMKAQMKEHLSTLPEEQRKVYEQRMEMAEKQAKTPPPQIEVQTSDKTETIQGLTCKVVTISVEGKPVRESCIAKEGIDEKDISQLNTMFKFMEEVSLETAKIRGMPAPDTKAMSSQQDGVAIKTHVLPTGVKNELTTLSTDTLDDKDFTVPEGYTVFDPKVAMQAAQKKQAPTSTPKAPATTTPEK